MSAEAMSAFVLAALWVVAGAASAARPRLRLGNYLVLTCWLLAAGAAAGGVLAVLLDETSLATWAVAGWSVVVIGLRIRTSTFSPGDASAEGRTALTLLGLGLAGCAGVGLAAWVTREVLDFPQRVGLVMIVLLGVVAALTSVVHVFARHGQRLAIAVLGGVGTAVTISGLAVAFTHALFGDLDEQVLAPAEAIGAGVGAALVSLAVVPGSLAWLTTRVNRGRPDRHHVLDGVEQLVQRRLPLEETLLQVCEVLRTALQLDRAEVWTVTGAQLQLTASDPHRTLRSVELSDTARRVAAEAADSTSGDWVETWMPGVIANDELAAVASVSYAGALQGLLVAFGLDDGEASSEVLDEIAHRLGPVMHSASLDASLGESVAQLREREQSLRASRERLVAAADNERARIERDLHDGAQQHLVALGVNLQLARGLVRSNPDRAESLLDDLSLVARQAVEELRSLSHGIFPKTLEDQGIGPALDEASNRQTEVSVNVVTSGLRRFPREVETAVYFACNEAITNAIKHAGAASVSVHLVGQETELVFEVLDDGTGFDPDAVPSHGLVNMTDRIGAIDGDLTITSGDTGTRVLGTVPLGQPRT